MSPSLCRLVMFGCAAMLFLSSLTRAKAVQQELGGGDGADSAEVDAWIATAVQSMVQDLEHGHCSPLLDLLTGCLQRPQILQELKQRRKRPFLGRFRRFNVESIH